MKHILFFLLLTTAAIGQRDTTFQNDLKTHEATINQSGNNRYYKLAYKSQSSQYMVETDTFDITVQTEQVYLDSLLNISRADSTSAVIDVENFFLAYKRRNTTLQNIIEYMRALWAIKQ